MKTVRFAVSPERDNYFDVFGWRACGCKSSSERHPCEHDQATIDAIERDGLWHVAKERMCRACGAWEHVDSLGMVFGDQVDDVQREMGEDEDEVTR